MSIFNDTLKEAKINEYKYSKYKVKYLEKINNQNGSSSIMMKNEENLKMITPATIMKILENENVAIVNTLDNPYFLSKNPHNKKYESLYFDNKLIEQDYNKFDLIILYCANYTCSASKKYAEKLISKNNEVSSKIILYEGGLYEWTNLALNYHEFAVFNKETKTICSDNELYEINKSYSHWLETKKEGFPQYVYDNVGSSNFYKNLSEISPKKIRDGKLLENKVCVVTGATSGLGLETLKKMLDNGAKHVTGTYFNNDERAETVRKMLNEKYGESKVVILKADARTEEGNLLTFDSEKRSTYLTKEDLISVHCANINAGIFGPAHYKGKHTFNIKDEDYDKVMDLNLKGYYLGVKHFSRQAISNEIKNASIVCIKSIYGSTGSLFSNVAYQISKHGTMGLVRQAAIEMARPNEKLGLKHSIRVNAVSPTFTDTALTRPFLNYEKVFNTIADSNTTGELAKKEDVSNAVVFLCSELSGSITGIDLPVDCGVLAESVPTYREVKDLNNNEDIEELSCCGDTV